MLSVCFYRVMSTDDPPPFSGDPPAEAVNDCHEIAKQVYTYTESRQTAYELPFSIERPTGFYYLQVRAVLFRGEPDGASAQRESYLYSRRPIEVPHQAAGRLTLPISWPTVSLEDLHPCGPRMWSCGVQRQVDFEVRPLCMRRSGFRCQIEPPLGSKPVWKTMVLDPDAELTDPSKPPFVTAPSGSRPYHDHPLLEETRIEGWCIGVVTDPFEPDCEGGCTIGDAFVEAPDGSRAGLVWTVGERPMFGMVCQPDSRRWGVFHFTVPAPVASMVDLRAVFTAMLPTLKGLYEQFRPGTAEPGEPADRPRE
jgi:hypothetical protein